jgi:hypothetical protein
VTPLEVIAIMAALHPSAPRTGAAGAVAVGIARAVTEEASPVFDSRRVDAAALVITAWEEGRFCFRCRRGDTSDQSKLPASVGTWQIRATSETWARRIESDPILGARIALGTMRESARICPEHPLAPYCGSCSNSIARGIGDRRIEQARKLAAWAVQP